MNEDDEEYYDEEVEWGDEPFIGSNNYEYYEWEEEVEDVDCG